ncbi:uncharacterized protein [Gossypium hirsutum]|uniref:Uncharacterized protein n=1 Tax=Gossypium hirsutum TaxID=3635 RepID=A0A1U8JKR4_GOSHI|nr:uncharacterized protein LOC107908130 [Gossypium hirsutum]
MTPTPLLNILTENKLNENNYKELKKNLIIVLSCEKLKIVLVTKCPPATQTEARKHWEESDEIVRCYMLSSVTNSLYKQLKSYKTAKMIVDNQENMFRGRATSAPQCTITSLMNFKQKPDTPIKDHMITLMGYFTEAVDNEANLDQNIQIEMVFKSLSRDFVGFWIAYNLSNKNLTLKKFIKELQSYKLVLNGDQLVQKVKTNIVVASSSKGKGKCAKKGKPKVSRSPQVERK